MTRDLHKSVMVLQRTHKGKEVNKGGRKAIDFQHVVRKNKNKKQKNKTYPQSLSLCEPAMLSDAKVVGGWGTEVTCCQVGTKICCARLDQACYNETDQSHIKTFFLNQLK